MVRAKVKGWEITRHNGELFRAVRKGRRVYFKVVGDRAVQCDNLGMRSPAFVRAFPDDVQKKIAIAARSIPE